MQKAVAAQAAMHVTAQSAVLPILISLSFCHMLNDLMQSMIPALYPMIKDQFHLDFAQIGLITMAFQLTASLLQPAIGAYTDKRPQPYSLPVGMGATLLGLILLSVANDYAMVLFSAALVGVGSAVFHPEASRVTRMASGGRYSFAQSLFQVGGNIGSAIGPLLAALIVLPRGQGAIAWFSLSALVAMIVLTRVGMWYAARPRPSRAAGRAAFGAGGLSQRRVIFCVFVLMLLLFSKNVYNSSLTSFFTFYLIERFDMSVHDAQVQLFIFMTASAVGTLIGGPVTDRIGRRPMIWISIVGALPFTLALPYANLFWTDVLTVIIGLLMASAFPAILVYAQELVPGRIGMISGMFFGLAFGLGGLGAAVMGRIADVTSVEFIYHLCSYLPAIGLVTWLLPNLDRVRPPRPD